MDLPKINSIRSKELDINGKKVKLFPWTNIQLINYEDQLDENRDALYDVLVKDNIETKKRLTLTEERYLLYELYKLSKGNNVDILFNCSECDTQSEGTINIDKIVKFTPISSRTIKTGDFTISLRANSSYRMDLDGDLKHETLKYIISFVDSFIYKDTNYDGADLETMVEFFSNEVPPKEFNEFVNKMDDIQPKLEIESHCICAHCQHSNKINFRIEDFLV